MIRSLERVEFRHRRQVDPLMAQSKMVLQVDVYFQSSSYERYLYTHIIDLWRRNSPHRLLNRLVVTTNAMGIHVLFFPK